MTRWQVGDHLLHARHGVVRVIVAVRRRGYTWTTPELWPVAPDDMARTWWSENSTDPLFECGWTRLSGAALRAEGDREAARDTHGPV